MFDYAFLFFLIQRSQFRSHWLDHIHKPLEGRNKILKSFCPEIFAMYAIKLGVCLTLIGGVKVHG